MRMIRWFMQGFRNRWMVSRLRPSRAEILFEYQGQAYSGTGLPVGASFVSVALWLKKPHQGFGPLDSATVDLRLMNPDGRRVGRRRMPLREEGDEVAVDVVEFDAEQLSSQPGLYELHVRAPGELMWRLELLVVSREQGRNGVSLVDTIFEAFDESGESLALPLGISEQGRLASIVPIVELATSSPCVAFSYALAVEFLVDERSMAMFQGNVRFTQNAQRLVCPGFEIPSDIQKCVLKTRVWLEGRLIGEPVPHLFACSIDAEGRLTDEYRALLKSAADGSNGKGT